MSCLLGFSVPAIAISGRELLSKWKNIRTCFKREYNIQATMAPGSKAKKRRKYIHYDQLSFLLPTVDSKEENSNIIFRNSKSIDWKQCNSVETEKTTARPSTSYGPKRPSQPYEEVSVEKPSRKPSKSYEETLLQMLQEKRNEENEIDEDRYFLLSLLPSFRKLNEEQKFMAKTEILNVIRRARLFDPYVESSNTAASPSASLSVHCTSETILKQEENSCSSDDSSILCSK